MSCCYCESLICLIDHKAIIHSGGRRYCVLILDVCPTYIKSIEVCSGSIRIFNLSRIDFVEALC
ncbi:MAG: hypothetical protein ACRC1P_02935 [Cellulosilyticaceae bacterium]